MTERGPTEIPEAVYRQSPEYKELQAAAKEIRRERQAKERERGRSTTELALAWGTAILVPPAVNGLLQAWLGKDSGWEYVMIFLVWPLAVLAALGWTLETGLRRWFPR